MVNIYATYNIKPTGRKWPKFKRIHAVLQQNIRESKSIQQDVFALLMVLEDHYKKWYDVAIRTDEEHSAYRKIKKVAIALTSTVLSKQQINAFRVESYRPRLLYEVCMKTTGLDYFFYSEGLRSNTQIKWVWFELRRNMLLFTIHVGLYYGIPIALSYIHSYLILLLIPSILFNIIHGYRESKMFYFLNKTTDLLGLKTNYS